MYKKIIALFLLLIMTLSSCNLEGVNNSLVSSSGPVPPTEDKNVVQYFWENYAANIAFSLTQLSDRGFSSPDEIYPEDARKFLSNELIWSGEYANYLSGENAGGFLNDPEGYVGPIYLEMPHEKLKSLAAGYFGTDAAYKITNDAIVSEKGVSLVGDSMFLKAHTGTEYGIQAYNIQVVNHISLVDVSGNASEGFLCEFHSSGALQTGENENRVSAIHKLELLQTDGNMKIVSSRTEYILPAEIEVYGNYTPFENIGETTVSEIDPYELFQGMIGNQLLCLEDTYDGEEIVGQTLFTVDLETGQKIHESKVSLETYGAALDTVQILESAGPVLRCEKAMLVYDQNLNLLIQRDPPDNVSGDYILTNKADKIYYCSDWGLEEYNYWENTGRRIRENTADKFGFVSLWEEKELVFAKSYNMENGQSKVFLFDVNSGNIVTQTDDVDFVNEPVFVGDKMLLLTEDQNSNSYKGLIYTLNQGWKEINYEDFDSSSSLYVVSHLAFYFNREKADGINQHVLMRIDLFTGEKNRLSFSSTVAYPVIHGFAFEQEVFVIGVYYPGYKTIGSFRKES